VVGWKKFRQYRWQPFVSSDARFRINFPGDPIPSQENTTASGNGSKFISYKLTTSPAHGVVYSVAWWENPGQKDKSTEELLADFRDCYIRVFHGRILREERVSTWGYPASDTELLSEDRLAVDNRVIRVGPRLYSLWVVDSSGRFDRKNVKTFFNSFSVH